MQATQIMRKRLSLLGAGFAMALGALGIAGSQTAQALPTAQANHRDAVAADTKSRNQTPGSEKRREFDPIASLMHDAGMSPKEYGLRYGSGASRKGKSNRLRLSHNAKLARRG